MDVKCKNTVLSDAEKIKEQHWITLDVFGNQELKKILSFQTNDGPNKPQNIKECLFINNLKQGTVEQSSLSYFNTSLQWI